MKPVYVPKNEPMKVAGFMSGTGTNLRKILETQKRLGKDCSYRVVLVFSDVKDEKKCNARKIAEEFGINYLCNDIREYYSSRGHTDRKDMGVRKEYDAEIANVLKEKSVGVVALCGYMSITTKEIFNNFLTVNVHPADLRVLGESGKKLYAGCNGAQCIRWLIRNNGKEMRATTHIVNEDVDGGPILMTSQPVKLDRSLGPEDNLDRLKEKGDWTIFPETLNRLAKGRFWIDENDIILDIVEEKMLLRQRMRELRDNLSDDDVKKRSSAISKRLVQLEEYAKASTVMFYMGINKEVHTEDAVRAALDAKKVVAVPVTDLEKGRIIAAQLSSLNDVRPGAYGILEPAETKEVDAKKIDLVVVPGIAFDVKGNRVGYGLGFYDRFLNSISAKRVGLAYEMQIVDRILPTWNDVQMDAVVTEKQVIRNGA